MLNCVEHPISVTNKQLYFKGKAEREEFIVVEPPTPSNSTLPDTDPRVLFFRPSDLVSA